MPRLRQGWRLLGCFVAFGLGGGFAGCMLAGLHRDMAGTRQPGLAQSSPETPQRSSNPNQAKANQKRPRGSALQQLAATHAARQSNSQFSNRPEHTRRSPRAVQRACAEHLMGGSNASHHSPRQPGSCSAHPKKLLPISKPFALVPVSN